VDVLYLDRGLRAVNMGVLHLDCGLHVVTPERFDWRARRCLLSTGSERLIDSCRLATVQAEKVEWTWRARALQTCWQDKIDVLKRRRHYGHPA